MRDANPYLPCPPPTKLEAAIDNGTRAALDNIAPLIHGVAATPTQLEKAIEAATLTVVNNITPLVRGLKGEPLDDHDTITIRQIIKSNILAAIDGLMARRA